MARPKRKFLDLDKIIEKEKMLKNKKVCKEVNRKVCKEVNKKVRKVRISYNDPDATDSSSDQANGYSERVKCVVREVNIPMFNSKEGSYATERTASRLKEVEYRKLLAKNKNNLNAASSCASEETTGLYSHPSPSSVLDVSKSMQVIDGSSNLVKEAVVPLLQIIDNVQQPIKSIRLMTKLVLKDELPDMEFDYDPILSPLPDHYSDLDYCEDFGEHTVKKSPLIFDDQVRFFGCTNVQMQKLEYRPAIRKLELDFELGKDELDWLNGL